MASALITMPDFTAASRTASIGGSKVLGPSPETSITRRVPSNLLLPILSAAKATASPMALPPGQRMRSLASIAVPKATAEARPVMRVQGTLRRVQPSPANSI